jgi:uncharacterized protein YndB with AHSA1/START domain
MSQQEAEMTGTNSATLRMTLPSEREIAITRIFDAPRQRVFDALTQPEHLTPWFGREGDTLTSAAADLRPGGAWRFEMRLRDGADMTMVGAYQEVSSPGRLVYTESWSDWPDKGSLNIVVLEERDGKTEMTVTSIFDSQETRDVLVEGGMEAGAIETYDRLEAYLRVM